VSKYPRSIFRPLCGSTFFIFRWGALLRSARPVFLFSSLPSFLASCIDVSLWSLFGSESIAALFIFFFGDAYALPASALCTYPFPGSTSVPTPYAEVHRVPNGSVCCARRSLFLRCKRDEFPRYYLGDTGMLIFKYPFSL